MQEELTKQLRLGILGNTVPFVVDSVRHLLLMHEFPHGVVSQRNIQLRC
jgi:hypothetical protein